MPQPKIANKLLKKTLFGGSESFIVIDVDIPKKLVTSACYHKQDVCAYLQLCSCWTRQYQ